MSRIKYTQDRCSNLRIMWYVCDMIEMAHEPAVWRKEMTSAEQRELELAERTRAAAVEQYRAVYLRLKHRCIQRVRAKAAKDAD